MELRSKITTYFTRYEFSRTQAAGKLMVRKN